MLAGCKQSTQETNDISIETEEEIITVTESPVVETPVVEEEVIMVAESPVVDTPVVEEEVITVTESPVVETPVVEEEVITVTTRPVIKIPAVEEETVVQEELKPTNWYIRLVAEDLNRSLKTNSAQLGILEESDAAVKHTLISHGRFTGPYLDVVFIDPDSVAEGVYKTNYHTYQEGAEERWRFTVQTDDNTAEILLTWRGLYLLTPYIDDKNREQYKEYRSLTNLLIDHMKLVDVDTGREIIARIDGKMQTYVLNMNGQNERVFEWVVQNEVAALPTQNNKLVTRQAKSIQKNVSIAEKKPIVKRSKSFDLSKPPLLMEK